VPIYTHSALSSARTITIPDRDFDYFDCTFEATSSPFVGVHANPILKRCVCLPKLKQEADYDRWQLSWRAILLSHEAYGGSS